LPCFKGLLLGHGSDANDNAACHWEIGVSCRASNPPIITPVDRLCKTNGNYWRSIGDKSPLPSLTWTLDENSLVHPLAWSAGDSPQVILPSLRAVPSA
jgi:hypothetical protein